MVRGLPMRFPVTAHSLWSCDTIRRASPGPGPGLELPGGRDHRVPPVSPAGEQTGLGCIVADEGAGQPQSTGACGVPQVWILLLNRVGHSVVT